VLQTVGAGRDTFGISYQGVVLRGACARILPVISIARARAASSQLP